MTTATAQSSARVHDRTDEVELSRRNPRGEQPLGKYEYGLVDGLFEFSPLLKGHVLVITYEPSPPFGWTKRQLKAFQRWWDAIL